MDGINKIRSYDHSDWNNHSNGINIVLHLNTGQTLSVCPDISKMSSNDIWGSVHDGDAWLTYFSVALIYSD